MSLDQGATGFGDHAFLLVRREQGRIGAVHPRQSRRTIQPDLPGQLVHLTSVHAVVRRRGHPAEQRKHQVNGRIGGRGASAGHPELISPPVLREQPTHRRDLTHLDEVPIEPCQDAMEARHVASLDQRHPPVQIVPVRLAADARASVGGGGFWGNTGATRGSESAINCRKCPIMRRPERAQYQRKTAVTTTAPSGFISTFTAVARVRIPLGVPKSPNGRRTLPRAEARVRIPLGVPTAVDGRLPTACCRHETGTDASHLTWPAPGNNAGRLKAPRARTLRIW